MSKRVMIYTDGACKGNPGPGGWCAILRCEGREKVISGGQSLTTNNKMELTAVIEALKTLKYPCEAVVTSDSKYVCDAVGKGWVYSWQKKGWKKSDGKPALNAELWQELLGLLRVHTVSFNWIKGHAGHEENERCDKIAVEEAKKAEGAV